jgi:hypothetical protein
MQEKCENCRWFRLVVPDKGLGFCLRYPPRHVDYPPHIENLWPIVWLELWCGEFQFSPPGP